MNTTYVEGICNEISFIYLFFSSFFLHNLKTINNYFMDSQIKISQTTKKKKTTQQK